MKTRLIFISAIVSCLLISVTIGEVTASIFDRPVIPLYLNITETHKVIIPYSLLCFIGLTDDCNVTEITKTTTIKNAIAWHPFKNTQRTVAPLDWEDREFARRYPNLIGEILDCAEDKMHYADVYDCALGLIRENNLTCRWSASATKLALMSSNISEPYTIIKVYSYDDKNGGHRYIVIHNENGYYVLDPLLCVSDTDACVERHTWNFFHNARSIHYRGNVYDIGIIEK